MQYSLLRAEEIRTQKQNINDTAFALTFIVTIAAWLSDGTTKDSNEIEYERTKTDSFINDKIEIIVSRCRACRYILSFYGLTAPELNIMPESQITRSDNIRLYSELFDKGQVPAKNLAEKILGTCSVKEVNELAEYIDEQKQVQTQPPFQPQEQQMGELLGVETAEASNNINKGAMNNED